MDDSTAPRTPVSAALIGCGNIGSAWDEGRPGPALTHAGAIDALGLDLVAVCDVDPERVSACAAARGVEHSFTDPAALFRSVSADIACIATPTFVGRHHLVELALDAGAKAIFCEKPLDRSLQDAEALRLLVPDDFPFAVNYLRSWSPGLVAALEWVDEIGTIDHVVVRYDKGFSNNGSHAIDLLRHFVGWPTAIEILRVRDDGRDDDPTVDVKATFAGGAAGYFLSSDYREYSRFEIELVGDRGRIAFQDKGRTVVLETRATDRDYPTYRVLAEKSRKERALDGALTRALDSVVAASRDHTAPIGCTLSDALATMRVVDQVQRALR